MRNKPLILSAGLLILLISGCTTAQQRTSIMASSQYAERPTMTGSLFPADQAVLGDDAIERILSSKLELPQHAKVALINFQTPESRSYYHWTNEDEVRMEQDYAELLSTALLQSDQIQEVTPLPSLMTPRTRSIPVLREATVRMQADLLLIFRIRSHTYTKYRAFAKDKVKAYSTCEFVLLDVRTGLVPFTRIVTRERFMDKQSDDFDLSETMRRAEKESAMEALSTGARNLVQFLETLPKKDG